MTQRLVGTASMRSMTFLQVDRCSNEPFSTYCVYCVFYKLILRILRILQIVILEYCVYCVFYKLTSANIAYIAYIAYIALRILRCVALRCVFYNKPARIKTNSFCRQLFVNVFANCFMPLTHSSLSLATRVCKLSFSVKAALECFSMIFSS